MKKILLIFAALLIGFTGFSQSEKDYLFMPKGTIGAGIQLTYVDLGSTDSDVMLVLKDLNAKGIYSNFAPFLVWNYKDNRAIGVKLSLSRANASVSSADLSLFSDDLSLSVEDIKVDTHSYTFQIFRRSYMALDMQKRFGLFNDINLSYSNSRNSFSYNEETLDSYSDTEKIKLGVSPGIMIFILNNVSTQVSMNIGGVSFSHTDCVKNGETVGSRNHTKAHFAPDIAGISFGLTFYIK